ncbi:MAG TPA: adenylate/guanylate cyclase domain-containing protein, partial [Candidatus Rifleibacterium sp.]|nr:adenylate/guanylate cyclase domain-containing protein [Candidatus Rifleibacterium sp.]
SHNETMLLIAVTPEDEIMTAIEKGRRRFLAMLLVSILALVLLTLLVASDVALPVRQLHAGVKMMASQQYDFRIASNRSDELGQMLQAFNGMARGLQERELMGQMVSRAARRIASDEKSLRKAESGMHLDVTVLYLSVPGFAELQKKLASEDLLAGVSAQVDVLCGIIINNDGEADKIIGEKILAYFYSPEGLKKSNAMAMRALQIISAAERDGLLPFPVAAGIHCGSVIAGLLGISSKRDFTIIGDTVNTAARINAQASELAEQRYLVSTLAADGFEDKNRLSPFGSVALKGKTETVDLLHARI